MEITEFLLRIRWRLAVVAVATVVAGVAVFAYLAARPDEYRTTATVVAPAEINTINEVSQWVLDFLNAVDAGAVRGDVAEELDVPRSLLRRRVSAERVGQSGIVTLTYTADRAGDERATETLSLFVDVALEFMSQSGLDRARSRFEEASDRLIAAEADEASASAAVDDFLESQSFIRPDAELEVVRAELSRLTLRQAELRASGLNEVADRLGDSVAELEQRVSDLGRAQARIVDLESDLEAARAARVEAEDARDDAVTALDRLTRTARITFAGVDVPVDRSAETAAGTAAAAAAAFAVGLIGVVWLEALRRPGSGAGSGGGTGAPATA